MSYWCSLQRCLSLYGLALHRATAAHRGFAGHEVGRQRLQSQSEDFGCRLGPDPRQRLWGVGQDGRPHAAPGVLVPPVFFFLEVVYELLVDLSVATEQDPDKAVEVAVSQPCWGR